MNTMDKHERDEATCDAVHDEKRDQWGVWANEQSIKQSKAILDSLMSALQDQIISHKIKGEYEASNALFEYSVNIIIAREGLK